MSNYKYYKDQLKGLDFPYAVLDITLFNKNIQANLERAGNKKIRLASKSLRCEKAMTMILDYSDQFQGLMTYNANETLYLAKKGFDDLLIGYPVVSYNLIKALGETIKKGKQICLMVDSLVHLEMINTVGEALNVQMPICIDLDLSSDLPGLRFGVWRSSLMTIKDLEIVLKALKKMD